MGELDEILNSIENDNMKRFAEEAIKTIPEYWYHVGASSTGKYHPSYALGEGGLMRHTIAVVRFLNHIFETEMFNFNSRERDMLRIAGLMHDTRKSGDQAGYESNKYTRFDHPCLAAYVVLDLKSKNIISEEEVNEISDMIETHMGRWNYDKRSDITLQKPSNKYQKLLHIADYLASRKDIEVKFEGFEAPKASPETFKMPFGKYKDQKLSDIIKTDKDYLIWLRDKADMELREPLKSLIADL